MSAIQIIELVVFIVLVAGILGYLFQSGKNTEEQEPFIKTPYTKEELENIKLAEELYNKDLRPIIPQSIPKTPKAKPIVDIEVAQPEFVPSGLSRTPVAPEFPNVGKDFTKVFPPEATINAEAVEVLATIAKNKNIPFITYSTDYVFSGNATSPYTTDTPLAPINFYGQTKADGELMALAANPDAIIIRTSWVFSSHGNNFVKTMIRLMKERDSLNIV